MHASSNDPNVRSGRSGSGLVAPGSRRLAEFFLQFAEMPHRGSATPNEQRAARLLISRLESETSADVELQPFAVDLSSGAWGVAVHGVLLVLVTAAVWLAGLAAASAWGVGPRPVRLGFLGTVHFPYAVAALAWCLAMIGSRLVEDKIGFHIASFFVPNADSCNVIATSLQQLDPTSEILRMSERDRWKKRFEEAHGAGTSRIVVLMGHYDSARRLPPVEPPRFLLAALKGGMGRLLNFMYFLLALTLAVACAIGLFRLNGVVYSGWIGILVSIVLALTSLVAMGFAAAEGGMAAWSASLPFVQGLNDNLSGPAAIYGAIAKALPHGGRRKLAAGTEVIAVFTGSEENGLRGASRFAKDVLRPAMEVFGVENVEVINLDSVSGGALLARPREVNFSGREVGGKPLWAKRFHEWATGERLSRTDARAVLTQEQIRSCLVRHGTRYGLKLDYQEDPLPACTDLTGVWAGLRRRHRRALRGFSIVSRLGGSADPLSRPRDYHQESDNLDTLFLHEEPANFGTVAALARILEAYLG